MGSGPEPGSATAVSKHWARPPSPLHFLLDKHEENSRGFSWEHKGEGEWGNGGEGGGHDAGGEESDWQNPSIGRPLRRTRQEGDADSDQVMFHRQTPRNATVALGWNS